MTCSLVCLSHPTMENTLRARKLLSALLKSAEAEEQLALSAAYLLKKRKLRKLRFGKTLLLATVSQVLLSHSQVTVLLLISAVWTVWFTFLNSPGPESRILLKLF